MKLFKKIRITIAILLYPEIKKFQPEIRTILKNYLTITLYDNKPVILGIIRKDKAIQKLIIKK